MVRKKKGILKGLRVGEEIVKRMIVKTQKRVSIAPIFFYTLWTKREEKKLVTLDLSDSDDENKSEHFFFKREFWFGFGNKRDI